MDFTECQNLCNLDHEDVEELLPDKWDTKVMEIRSLGSDEDKVELKIRIAATTTDEIKQWIREYEEITHCTYSVQSTPSCSGIYVHFKQILYCHHKTRSSKIYTPASKNRTKNTNCPSYINITLRRVTKKARFKDARKRPDGLRPCEIVLVPTHNHKVDTAEFLRFSRIAPETKEKLIKFFHNGHSPATALESLKFELQLTDESLLEDRRYCPNYQDCYYLYTHEFKKLFGSTVDVHDKKKFLEERIRKYNEETSCESARVTFLNSDYVVSVCPPLMRRVHEHISSASEVMFVTSIGTSTSDHEGTRVCVLQTHSECGGLPLGVIVTSLWSAEVLTIGFHQLKEIIGPDMFRGRVVGPKVAVADDSDELQTALKSVWKRPIYLLCAINVLQNIWKWLVKPKNCIKLEDQEKLLKGFKSIMYACSVSESEKKYLETVSAASNYRTFQKLLEKYWDQKEHWVLIYRSMFFKDGRTSYKLTETATRIVKEKILGKVKAFNFVQVLDFVLTIFVQYFQSTLLDAANNRAVKNILIHGSTLPKQSILDSIQTLSDGIHVVPSESVCNLYYIVNSEVLLCTCVIGNAGKLCKHINWVLRITDSAKQNKKRYDVITRRIFHLIATGDEPSESRPSEVSCLTTSDADSNDSKDNFVGIRDIVQQPVEKYDVKPNPVDNLEIVIQCGEQYDFRSSPVETFEIVTQCEEKEGETKVKDKAQEIVHKLCNHFQALVEKSPFQVKDALEAMEKKISKVGTASEFVTACSKFASESEGNHETKLPVQPANVIIKHGESPKEIVRLDVQETIMET